MLLQPKKFVPVLSMLLCLFICTPILQAQTDSTISLPSELVDRIKDLSAESRVRTLVAEGWVAHKNPAMSLLYAKRAEEDSSGYDNIFLKDSVYRLMAFSYGDLNNRSATLNAHLKRLRILSELDTPTFAAASANYEAAGAMSGLLSNDQALPYYEECVRISRDGGFATQESQALIAIASFYREDGRLMEALSMLLDARKLWEDYPRFLFMKGFIDVERSKVLAELGQQEKAYELASDALQYVQDESIYADYVGLIYQGAADRSLERKKFSEAIDRYHEARSIMEKHNKLFYLPDVYRSLSKCYEPINSDSAYYYLERYVDVNDSVVSADNKKQIAELKIAYEDEKKAREIQLLTQANILSEQEKALSEAESSQKSVIIWFSCSILAVVLVLMVFLIRLLNTVRRQNNLVNWQKQLVEERNREIEDSIVYAQRIQMAMIPQESRFVELFPDAFVLYLPKDKLSGDFYWCSEVTTNQNQRLQLFSVGDCTGHGVPGALLSMLGVNYLGLGSVDSSVNTPAQALDYLNRGVNNVFRESKELIRDGMDISLGAIDRSQMKLYFATAKNPIYVVRAGEIHTLRGDKHSIGRDDHTELKDFTDHQFDLHPGDMIYMASDGYQDQFGGQTPHQRGSGGKKFKVSRLRKILTEISNNGAEQQRQTLLRELTNWQGEMEQVDDITIVGVRV